MVEIGVILLLLLANGAFAMTEIAVVPSRKARLRQFANAGYLRARDHFGRSGRLHAQEIDLKGVVIRDTICPCQGLDTTLAVLTKRQAIRFVCRNWMSITADYESSCTFV